MNNKLPKQQRVGATVLFDHLVQFEECVTYEHAHELLIGPVKGPWRNREHAVRVIEKSRVTVPRQLAGVQVQLDALVVQEQTGEPGAGHWNVVSYGKTTWRQAFGKWRRCAHGRGAFSE